VDDAPFTEDLPLTSVGTSEELGVLLRAVYLRADKPSLRSLEARTRHDPTPLYKSTVSGMLKSGRLPRKAIMLSFLRACGIREEQTGQWQRAWERIAAHDVERAGSSERSTDTANLGHREMSRLQEQIVELNADNDKLRLQLNLARNSKEHGWWQRYDVPYRDYIALEAATVSLKTLHCTVVSGLLQTEEYARAVHERSATRLSPEEIEQGVQARLIRQSLFVQAKPPQLWVLLDEAALHRSVGGPIIMRNQLARIVGLSRLSSVCIQVLPYGIGALPSGEQSFTILEFAGSIPDVVYMQTLAEDVYLRQGPHVDLYRKIFEQLRQMALTVDDSATLIEEIARHT
jgi:hypothetical protein